MWYQLELINRGNSHTRSNLQRGQQEKGSRSDEYCQDVRAIRIGNKRCVYPGDGELPQQHGLQPAIRGKSQWSNRCAGGRITRSARQCHAWDAILRDQPTLNYPHDTLLPSCPVPVTKEASNTCPTWGETWGSCGDRHEGDRLLKCCVVQSGRKWLVFQRCDQPADGGSRYLRNVDFY